MKVLYVIDDSPVDVELLRAHCPDYEILHHFGNESVNDFIQRKNQYKDQPKPDVVLLDVNLSNRQGFELVPPIHKTWPDVAICMTSGVELEQQKVMFARALNIDFAYYRVKPVRQHYLDAILSLRKRNAI